MELSELNKEIENKSEQLFKLRDQAHQLNDEINNLKQQRLEVASGLKYGDMVCDYGGKFGVLDHNDGTWWYWRKLKKDGLPSKVLSCTYSSGDTLKKVDINDLELKE